MTKTFLNKHILNISTKTQRTAGSDDKNRSDDKNHSAVGKMSNLKTEGILNYFFKIKIMS